MNIPLNGRIAIIDDNINQALPLINVLAQKRCPYYYFSGEMKFLPKTGEAANDIRVLFLDINLIGDEGRSEKELRSKLVSVLSRVISKNNYPYVLIYWSRNETEYSDLVKDIFNTDLEDRCPIEFLSQNKLSFYELDGSIAEGFEDSVNALFDNVNKLISNHSAYSHLIQWENQVHCSADKTLQEIFFKDQDWSNNASYLITKLGESYAGKKTYQNQQPPSKIKSSFQAFNNVFYDTLEYHINNFNYNGAEELKYNPHIAKSDNLFTINKKLLISDENHVMEYSGSVTEDSNEKSNAAFSDLLNAVFDRKKAEEDLKKEPANQNKNTTQINKLVKFKKDEIKESWKKIYFVVTPLCDYVQVKAYNVRVVKGILVKTDHLKYIDNRSEAVFVSPKFKYEQYNYAMVLHFRYFFTSPGGKNVKNLNPLFRVRQQMLSEIQSRLARHVSRQGILFLEEH